MILTLVDYGAGNLPSVERALRRLGAETKRATGGAALAGADAIVLPGVGHFHALARALAQDGLGRMLRAEVDRGVPLLGICLGLQAFYERSEESPDELGLGWLPGVVKPLPTGVKLPHMGWNQLRRRGPSALLAGIPEDAWFYFAHGYAALETGEEVVAVCEHGVDFVAVIERGPLYGVQFHPEKSGLAGAAILRNFLELAR
ncbi:MAG TPA: imidazole glycerol phosphate synthase subunit HisH [Patescibacteria group bacterium]|nr:imidazole glycerol phosphate synthase subunit HisH [Patescibacteria group bacterium]